MKNKPFFIGLNILTAIFLALDSQWANGFFNYHCISDSCGWIGFVISAFFLVLLFLWIRTFYDVLTTDDEDAVKWTKGLFSLALVVTIVILILKLIL